jgi:hypothetical protein
MYLRKIPPLSYVLSDAELDLTRYNSRHVEPRAFDLPCGRHFYHDAKLPTSLSMDQQSGSYVFLFGLAIDLIFDTTDLDLISAQLLKSLDDRRTAFLDHIDLVAGRYLVIYRKSSSESPHIMGDATNMIKINYSAGHRMCSSNVFVIDDVANKGARQFREEYRTKAKHWTYGSLGNLSPIARVKILTPNHELALDSYEQRRFYPRRPASGSDNIAAISDEIVSLCLRQQSLLLERYALFNSLTAGIDSRFSLAISAGRSSQQIYFTYLLQEPHLVDAQVSSHIARSLGLDHAILLGDRAAFADKFDPGKSNVIDVTIVDNLSKRIKIWDWYIHGTQVVNAYKWSLLPLNQTGLPPLHIRSNLYEVGRLYWARKSGPCNDPSEILEKSRRDWISDCSAIFKKFFRETEINTEAVHGYDLLDIFYWEHRCGTWVSEVLQGSDFAFNTHCYVNCRKIIELMLSVDMEHRAKASVFHHAIEKHLPRLAGLPINPQSGQWAPGAVAS